MSKIWLLLCCASAALGQESAVQPDLSGLQYPALARSARVQGTVRFVVKDGAAELVSGHPMLVPTAKDNLEKWALWQSVGRTSEVDYVFALVATEPSEETVVTEQPIGDSIDRFFRRLLHRPTTRRLQWQRCLPPRGTTVEVQRGNARVVGSQGMIQVEVETGLTSRTNVD